MRTRHVMLLTTLLVSALATASAAATPEQNCQKGRYYAAAKYAQCEQKSLGAFFSNIFLADPAIGKCQRKYTATWPKLQAQASGTGSMCDNLRFNSGGNGTITDFLTGLQWEKKTDDGSIHDKDNLYTWNASPPPFSNPPADGEAFTIFLRTLNSGSCFAAQCDWRLPTLAELETILQAMAPSPCDTSPCIDEEVFGPTVATYYWSDTTFGRPQACTNTARA